jgi:hypothetical protein
MQAYAPGVAAAEAGVEVEVEVEVEAEVEAEAEAEEAVEAVREAVREAAFRRIDKNPTYFYDRIMGIVTGMVTFVIHRHHHLFRISSTVPE